MTDNRSWGEKKDEEISNVCSSDYSRALKMKSTPCNKELPQNSF